MAKPAVIIVGADKGGVGKTTIARTLLDYLGAHQVTIRAFDTKSPRGTLKRFHPEVTEVVDITHVADQMKIFDTLNSSKASVTLIDVRAGLMSPTLKALRDIGFIDAARKGQITFALFHILGPTIASLDEINETATCLGDARYFMVKNFVNSTHFFEWDEATHACYFKQIKDAVEIAIPKLNEMATEQVELASVPYLTFVANKKQSGDPASFSFVLRGYVRHWLGNVWAEYDRINLTEIVAPKAPAVEDPEVAGTRLASDAEERQLRNRRKQLRRQCRCDSRARLVAQQSSRSGTTMMRAGRSCHRRQAGHFGETKLTGKTSSGTECSTQLLRVDAMRAPRAWCLRQNDRCSELGRKTALAFSRNSAHVLTGSASTPSAPRPALAQ